MDLPTLPDADPASDPQASLLDRLGAARGGRFSVGYQAKRTAWFCLIAIGLAAATIVLGAAAQRASAIEEMRASALQIESDARSREQATAMARTLALPPLDTLLALLRAHLPPDVRLIEASRNEDGNLDLAIDTADPDALRAALAGNPQMAPLRERQQSARDDGTIRVRLSGKL